MSLKSKPVPEEDAVRPVDPSERKRFNTGPKKKTRGQPPKPKIQYDDPKAAQENLEALQKDRPLKPPGSYPYTIGRHRSG